MPDFNHHLCPDTLQTIHPAIMSEPSTNGALEAFLPRLRSSIPSTSLSYLPTTLPLAFPSPLHLINTLTTIHIVHALLSHPSHISYFATTSTTPDDTAVRGVLGLYISSSEGWAKDNLLGATAWRTVMSEEKMTEYFGIETTREKEHDTMKGIKVGGRWDEGAKVVEGLVGLFRDLGEKLGGAKCLGEVVQDVLGRAKQQDDTGGYATVCCNEVCPDDNPSDPPEPDLTKRLGDDARALLGRPLPLFYLFSPSRQSHTSLARSRIPSRTVS